jgi:ubiquinone/menaquinone biosynthesis C-methylase UbiE
MNKNDRWNKAQEYELRWWQKRHKVINLSYLQKFADELMRDLSAYIKFDNSLKILEIGSGPAGIVTHLPGNVRIGIDPLENFYSSISEYSQYRDKNVKYFNTKGEKLEFENSYFNLVIIDNVLDHCEDPNLVISEVKRVLRNDGVIYFKQNVYHTAGKFIRNLLELVQFDKGHPYNFTTNDLYKLFDNNGLKSNLIKRRGHLKQLIVELKMKNVKALIRVLTLMTRDKITLAILKK